MSRGFDRPRFRPGEEPISGNEGHFDFSRPFGDDLDAFSELVRMGEEKGQVEATSRIQDLHGFLQCPAFTFDSLRPVLDQRDQAGAW